ncbi:MAG: pseudouridine synthase [Terracidiphilus sp.]|jgi:23S rRNA pseudouridine2605 synthase
MARKKKPSEPQPVSTEAVLDAVPEPALPALDIEDPIGDLSDGEAAFATGPEAEPGSESEIEAEDSPEPESSPEGTLDVSPEAVSDEAETEPEFKPRPPAKLERLQKILAAAGVASRRRAEELIEQGRVQVNGKVVTLLGTKADSGRDHIRVDGKLLQGPERLRYFVLNKPRGFVTTVKDPEGRPTVMQFFDKMRERLYPVGRLDYLSEGLLLVTNDGELANRLTRAAAGVEKTYLVKVSGQPTEAELDILRAGVSIERAGPGSRPVRTSPARIRQVRQGDNPWYEVVLIEGRNRELRKMFEEVGHFVEKIRRVGYGPLVLDQEPGNLRELDTHELELLRKAAEGTLRTPKSKELRRRNAADAAQLPTLAPRPSRPRPPQAGAKDYRPKRSFAPDEARPFRPAPGGFHPADVGSRPTAGPRPDRTRPRPAGRQADRFSRPAAAPEKFDASRSSGRPPARPDSRPSARSFPAKPAWKKDDRPTRPPSRFAPGPPSQGRPAEGRAFPAKPAWKKPESGDRRPFNRPTSPRPPSPRAIASPPREGFPAKGPTRLEIHEVPSGHSSQPTPGSARPRTNRPSSSHPGAGRSSFERPGRPFRSEGGLARPFTTSTGKPRAGGARPSSKPSGRSYGAPPDRASGSRPSSGRAYSDSSSRPERKTGPGWNPKPNFSGSAKPGGGHSKSGGSSYKGKSSGGTRSGPRPGGKRTGPPSGKRRS